MRNKEIEARIKEVDWWKGTEADWQALSHEERNEVAFKATGCLIAYPTWEVPVDCVHIKCQIRRGEKEPIELTEGVLMGERENGWLRFMAEEKFQQLREAVLKAAKETEIYDPWKLPGGWQVMVFGSIME